MSLKYFGNEIKQYYNIVLLIIAKKYVLDIITYIITCVCLYNIPT